MEAVAVLIHELVFLVLDEGALDLIGGLEAERHLHPVGNAAHVHLGHRRALAGMDVSVVTMTASLPSISTILPLRNELAMTFTGKLPCS